MDVLATPATAAAAARRTPDVMISSISSVFSLSSISPVALAPERRTAYIRYYPSGVSAFWAVAIILFLSKFVSWSDIIKIKFKILLCSSPFCSSSIASLRFSLVGSMILHQGGLVAQR